MGERAAVALELLLVAFGGMLGGFGRALVSTLVAGLLGERLPWGTFAVNLSGSLALGFLAGGLAGDPGPAPPLALFLATGLLGSYTTVSTFSLQTLFLLRERAFGRALLNVAGSAGLCIAAASLGFVLAGP
ncbi:MAG: fluoride efflux transporter CrcB [Geminicoccaceae bacterium]|jgi:CrcB protein|nr:fluoride efflux transporter CrcB [Geminicoccaceae bacterium]